MKLNPAVCFSVIAINYLIRLSKLLLFATFVFYADMPNNGRSKHSRFVRTPLLNQMKNVTYSAVHAATNPSALNL